MFRELLDLLFQADSGKGIVTIHAFDLPMLHGKIDSGVMEVLNYASQCPDSITLFDLIVILRCAGSCAASLGDNSFAVEFEVKTASLLAHRIWNSPKNRQLFFKCASVAEIARYFLSPLMRYLRLHRHMFECTQWHVLSSIVGSLQTLNGVQLVPCSRAILSVTDSGEMVFVRVLVSPLVCQDTLTPQDAKKTHGEPAAHLLEKLASTSNLSAECPLHSFRALDA